jgi:flagellar hook assembly protein FlgD
MDHEPIAIIISDIEDGTVTSNKFALRQNYPNPFNPVTKIPFSLDKKTLVEIKIYDINGRLIKRYSPKIYYPGEHHVMWDGKNNSGRDTASGIYYYHLSTTENQDIKKMVLIR